MLHDMIRLSSLVDCCGRFSGLSKQACGYVRYLFIHSIEHRMQSLLTYLFMSLCALLCCLPLPARELQATVTVNSTKVERSNRELFRSLEASLRTFINGRRWSDAPLRADAPITCSFTVVVLEATASGSFRGELYLQASRRLGATISPLLTWRDRHFDFDYTPYTSLDFNPHDIRDNLTASVAFYLYLLLGLDADAETLLGGTAYFREMEQIAAAASAQGWPGWELQGNGRSRSSLAAAFNDGAQETFRRMWYDYHANGLRLLATDGDRGREVLVAALSLLSRIGSNRPATLFIPLFGDTKLAEMTQQLMQGKESERAAAYEQLRRLYPTHGEEWERLRVP